MEKEDLIETEGTIVEALHGAKFMVDIGNGHTVRAHLSGKLRVNYIRVAVGDRVTVQITPYDLTKGRIIWRAK